MYALELCAFLERRPLAPDTVIYWRGMPVEHVWLLQHGCVRVLEVDVRALVRDVPTCLKRVGCWVPNPKP